MVLNRLGGVFVSPLFFCLHFFFFSFRFRFDVRFRFCVFCIFSCRFFVFVVLFVSLRFSFPVAYPPVVYYASTLTDILPSLTLRFPQVVHEFGEESKRKLLKFVTGSDRAPIQGLGSIGLVRDP